jgi:hypothetical protein
MKYADLHIHSTASDGSWTPWEVVKTAEEKGFSCIALADHDTVDGIEEALEAGFERGIEVIPAVEFSTLYDGGEVHILGYCIDRNNQNLRAELKKVSDARYNRGKGMVQKLQNLGIDISWQEVQEIAKGGSVGRPHIARVLLEKGYIESIGDAFTGEYIGNGGRAYVERYEISPEKAIQLIKAAGGIPVLAHPGFFKKLSRLEKEDITYLVEQGVQGIEVWHTKHSEEDTRFYQNIALEMELLLTGGSDCHGGNGDEVLMGQIKLPYVYVERLHAACGK